MNTIITEQTDQGEISIDVYSKLVNDRILFISGYIDDHLATAITATLLLKEIEDPEKKITLFINSDGGDIRNSFMICDTMNLIKCPIETVCLGAANDGAALVLVSGTPGMRYCTKNSFVNFGQLTSDYSYYSNLTDAQAILKRCLDDNKKMLNLVAKATNTSLKDIQKKFEKKVFMKSSEALKFKFVDKIIKQNR